MSAWPQYTMLTIMGINLFGHLIKDRSESTTWDRASGVLASFLVFGLSFGLLWAGGFWAVIGLPS